MNLITAFFKNLAAKFLANELASLKARLATASEALDKIEQNATHIPAEASAEVKKLAQDVLSNVLTASDKVRGTLSTEVHDWEKELYAKYKASAVVSYAEKLIADTKIFFAKF
jgi:hypothetical protein